MANTARNTNTTAQTEPKTVDPNDPKQVEGYTTAQTTSTKIRLLFAAGWTRYKITKHGGLKTRNGDPIRYQHVRNVLLQPLKRQA